LFVRWSRPICFLGYLRGRSNVSSSAPMAKMFTLTKVPAKAKMVSKIWMFVKARLSPKANRNARVPPSTFSRSARRRTGEPVRRHKAISFGSHPSRQNFGKGFPRNGCKAQVSSCSREAANREPLRTVWHLRGARRDRAARAGSWAQGVTRENYKLSPQHRRITIKPS